MDGLCGLYAVLNSLRTLWPNVPLDRPQRICIAALDNWPHAYLAGTYTRNIEAMLVAAQKHVNRSKRFQGRMAFERMKANRDGFLEDLEHLIADENAVAILGFEGDWNHWTVGRQIDRGFLRLVDSSGVRNLRLRDIGLKGDHARNELSYSTTFIVRRI